MYIIVGLFVLFFESGSHVAQVCLELLIFCLHLLMLRLQAYANTGLCLAVPVIEPKASCMVGKYSGNGATF